MRDSVLPECPKTNRPTTMATNATMSAQNVDQLLSPLPARRRLR